MRLAERINSKTKYCCVVNWEKRKTTAIEEACDYPQVIHTFISNRRNFGYSSQADWEKQQQQQQHQQKIQRTGKINKGKFTHHEYGVHIWRGAKFKRMWKLYSITQYPACTERLYCAIVCSPSRESNIIFTTVFPEIRTGKLHFDFHTYLCIFSHYLFWSDSLLSLLHVSLRSVSNDDDDVEFSLCVCAATQCIIKH